MRREDELVSWVCGHSREAGFAGHPWGRVLQMRRETDQLGPGASLARQEQELELG